MKSYHLSLLLNQLKIYTKVDASRSRMLMIFAEIDTNQIFEDWMISLAEEYNLLFQVSPKSKDIIYTIVSLKN